MYTDVGNVTDFTQILISDYKLFQALS